MISIIKIIGILFLVGLYCLYGMACLRFLKTPINAYTIAGFVVLGGLAGFVSFVAFGVMISEGFGLHGEGYKIAILFILSAIAATIIGIYSAKFIAKYKR